VVPGGIARAAQIATQQRHALKRFGRTSLDPRLLS
jgi:hypothetical protein